MLYFQVYAYNKELYSADGYYAIPVDELAFSYFLASYDEANIATQFAVSATTDCSVQVELPSITTSMSVLPPAVVSLSHTWLLRSIKNAKQFACAL